MALPVKRSRNALLRELGIGRIAVARLAAELPEGLLEELEQLTDRMLAIVSRDQGIELDYLDVSESSEQALDGDRVADAKLRFYFTAKFRRLRFSRATRATSASLLVGAAATRNRDNPGSPAGPDQGLSLLLEPRRDRRPLSIEHRQQRLLAGQAIHGLYRLAGQGNTVDQLIESLDSQSPFGHYAASELRYSRGRSALAALDSLSAARFLDSLE